MSAKSERLDRRLLEEGLAADLPAATALIRAGKVLVSDVVVDKPGTLVRYTAPLRLRGAPARFVSRGGLKLDSALTAFGVDPSGLVAADLGASTGGFTDCLLQRGAARVYAVDVGTHQLDYKLRVDPRVVVMEQTNVRHLRGLPEPIDLIVGDLSFISLRLVVEPIAALARPGAAAILLVKPQFEAPADQVGPGGKVSDPAVREAAVVDIIAAVTEAGWALLGRHDSPIPGARAGNIEILLHLRLPGGPP